MKSFSLKKLWKEVVTTYRQLAECAFKKTVLHFSQGWKTWELFCENSFHYNFWTVFSSNGVFSVQFYLQKSYFSFLAKCRSRTWDRTLVVLGHWTVFWHSQNNKDTYLQNVHFLFFQVFIGGKYWKCPSITGKSIEEFLERFFPFSRDDIDNSITKSNKIYLSKRLSWQLVLREYLDTQFV